MKNEGDVEEVDEEKDTWVQKKRLRRVDGSSLTRKVYMVMEACGDYQGGVCFFLQDLDQCLRRLFDC